MPPKKRMMSFSPSMMQALLGAGSGQPVATGAGGMYAAGQAMMPKRSSVVAPAASGSIDWARMTNAQLDQASGMGNSHMAQGAFTEKRRRKSSGK